MKADAQTGNRASAQQRLVLPVILLALALLACGQFGPAPTLPPAPATATASPSPGPGTPTPRPETITQPASTEGTPVNGGTPLPPLEGDVFAQVAAIGPEVPGTVTTLRFTPDGTLWLLTDQAVARLVGDAWEIYLPEYEGELVGVDDLHRVWVAAADGAAIEAWDGEAWQTFAPSEGWSPLSPGPDGRAVRPGLAADQAGRVWIATAADVRAFDGEQWQVYDQAALGLPEAAGSTSPQFNVAVARRDGAVWVSACDLSGTGPTGGGVRWFDGTAWQGAGSPVDTGCGGAMASSAQGPVWVGLDASVLAYEPDTGEWITHAAPAPPSGERFGFVADVALDLSERPWPLLAICSGASCNAGQVRYQIAEDGTWVQMGDVAEAEQSLLFDIAGGGWLLSETGAQRASAGQVQPAGEMRVLASTQDSVGQIYIAGEQAGTLALWLVAPGTE